MDSTHDYECYCGCGATIQVTFDGGFHGTTCTITPCPKNPPFVMAFQVRRSAVLEMTPKSGYVTQSHKNGLVAFQ